MRLTSDLRGRQHHVAVPRHKELRQGTLHAILYDVANYLEVDRATLMRELFAS